MKKLILSISIFLGLTAYAQTIPTSTVTGSLKINDSLNVVNDIKSNGDITAIGEVTATDTMRAQKDLLIDGNAKIGANLSVLGNSTFNGSLLAKQGLMFDNSNGIKFTPATAMQGDIFQLGNVAVHPHKTLPFVTCPIPGVPGTFMSLFTVNGVYRTESINGLVNATTEMYNTPWNGYGHIEVQGTDQFGGNSNELLLNFWCGRNTGINAGPNGGIAYFGNLVEMGFPQHKNIALHIKGKNAQEAYFKIDNQSNTTVFKVKTNGETQIGAETVTSGPHTDAMLTVNGKIACKEVRVFIVNWSDYVFDEKYKLLPLEEVEKYYLKYKHLPNIPSAEEVIVNGNELAKTDALLLAKIEELTMYIVELKKELNAIKQK